MYKYLLEKGNNDIKKLDKGNIKIKISISIYLLKTFINKFKKQE